MWRWAVIAVSFFLLLLLGSGWWRSSFGLEEATRRWGSLRGPADPASADPFAKSWSYTARELRLDHCRGTLRLVSNSYRSYGDSRELLQDWPRTWPGWTHHRIDTAAALESRWYAKSIADWSFGALGTTGGMHKGVEYRIFSAPYWLLMAAAAAPGVFTGWRMRRRALRARAGSCRACGYELGGLPGCPECGAGMTTSGMR